MSEMPKNSFQFVGNWVIDCVDVISDQQDHLESLSRGGTGFSKAGIVIITTCNFTVLVPFTMSRPFLRISRHFGAIAKEAAKEAKNFYCKDGP
jgi:hypothetical protein